MHFFFLGGLFWRLQEAVGSAAGLNQNIAVVGVAACSSSESAVCTFMHLYSPTAFIFVDLILGKW